MQKTRNVLSDNFHEAWKTSFWAPLYSKTPRHNFSQNKYFFSILKLCLLVISCEKKEQCDPLLLSFSLVFVFFCFFGLFFSIKLEKLPSRPILGPSGLTIPKKIFFSKNSVASLIKSDYILTSCKKNSQKCSILAFSWRSKEKVEGKITLYFNISLVATLLLFRWPLSSFLLF